MKKYTAAVLVLLAVLMCGCSAGSYPSKAITMVVPYSAGGTTDVTGRQLAAMLEKELGVTVTVVNQPGASGSIGCQTVLDAKADGYTILYAADSIGTMRTMGLSDISIDDFSVIMPVVNDPKVVVAAADSPYQTMQELIDDMTARPGKVKMSYTGPGGSGHVQALIFNKFGMDMALTAYSGGGDCILAVMNGQVDFTNSNLSTVTGYLESGDLKLLAVASVSRLEKYPETPTLAELVPGMEEYLDIPFTPLSLLVSADTPEEMTEALRQAAKAAVAEPEWVSFVEDNCLDKLYEKYPDEASALGFYSHWESLVSWLIYDAGAAQKCPEEFGIPRP